MVWVDEGGRVYGVCYSKCERESVWCGLLRERECMVCVILNEGERVYSMRHYNVMCVIASASTHCNTLQHTATHCNTLQHTATYCNMMCVIASASVAVCFRYGVATMSRLLKIIGLFYRISSLS